MATTNNLTEFLTSVADAIRARKSTSAPINPQNFASEIASISGGGGGDEPQPEGTHKVQFLDIDGTVLKTQYVEDGGSATAPANPSRTYCTFVRWVGGYSNVTKDTVVLPQYASSDGRSHYEIDAQPGDELSLSVYHDNANELTIDWGDGTTETVARASSAKTVTHAYTAAVKGWAHLSDTAYDQISLQQYSNKRHIVGYIDSGKPATLRERCRNCINLKYIVIPEGVTKINDNACNSCLDLTCLVIPEGVTSIGGSAFASCYSLASLVLPEGITSIGNYAFQNCYSLTSLVIPEGITSIGNYAFQNCYSLTSLVIPEGITSIGNYAFQNCYSLTSLVIPEGVTSIGAQSFQNCYSLTSLVIPEGVTSIGNYAFQGCYSLTSLVIPEGVTSIGAQSFQNCYSLTSLVIPSSVTTILTSAFQMGNHMVTIKSLPATPPTITNTTFGNMSKLEYIYVPDDSVETYKAATNWVAFADNILPMSEYTE